LIERDTQNGHTNKRSVTNSVGFLLLDCLENIWERMIKTFYSKPRVFNTVVVLKVFVNDP
jgi:hypothetical protein